MNCMDQLGWVRFGWVIVAYLVGWVHGNILNEQTISIAPVITKLVEKKE